MRLSAALLLCIVTQPWTATANVEKTIFLGPAAAAAALSNARPDLAGLGLQVVSPATTLLPLQVPVAFPTESAPHGLESWYLLRGLDHGRRYEVRICWPATQPADFWLDTYPLDRVFDTPDLAASLSRYSQHRQDSKLHAWQDSDEADPNAQESVLLLRLQAAAFYYSTNRTLMHHPPPVHVDIILDPFVLNVFPQSLGPVAIYITLVALGAYFLSASIYRWLLSIAADSPSKPHTE
ncbi:hypothetical protein ACJQWK_01963 [Exserohilum turcicum]|uniref:Uncharacterized protein n=1 Tax=Exserohilum turcicum (strain 28A) TaxID=671987 RepID=R0KKM7_EXST2|nr:uncharacterized protein SETTUDRAFT_106952 [Exserohilum turcica Et28A]EOA88527.1 hypothetical protein SETTUDRAFT_106952 [Exserohilum turcica Et28A]